MSLWNNHRWWILRLAVLPIHVLVFALIAFFLVRLVPGDPVLMILREGAPTAEDYARVQAALGLDGTLFDQFLRFLGRLVQFDFGTSLISSKPVMGELAQRLPITLQLTLIGMGATIVLAFVGSAIASLAPTTVPGRIFRAYARAAGAVPDFVLGIVSIFLFYVLLKWAPAPIGLVGATQSLPDQITGFSLVDALLVGDWAIVGSILQHLALPVLVLAIGFAPLIMKILVLTLDDAIDAPSTRFRVSTGASRFTVTLSVFRRALPPAVVVCGMLFGGLLGGSVVLDQLFSLGGMGQYAVSAIASNDFPVMQGFLILTAAISLVVYLIVDIVNMLLDPRRRPGVRSEA
ncbi:ABC transporter permease [Microbacteriaceae bacterium VKM Ac-2855]|nr:ABC transporter permease [Microbacteriaceae bacterium VKM Ac-2855]